MAEEGDGHRTGGDRESDREDNSPETSPPIEGDAPQTAHKRRRPTENLSEEIPEEEPEPPTITISTNSDSEHSEKKAPTKKKEDHKGESLAEAGSEAHPATAGSPQRTQNKDKTERSSGDSETEKDTPATSGILYKRSESRKETLMWLNDQFQLPKEEDTETSTEGDTDIEPANTPSGQQRRSSSVGMNAPRRTPKRKRPTETPPKGAPKAKEKV